MEVTFSALARMRDIIAKNNASAMRVSLQAGGCNGFEYRMKPISSPEPGDEQFSKEGVDVFVCPKSLLYFLGTTVDWQEDVMGHRFVFLNPNAKSECGCKHSFGI